MCGIFGVIAKKENCLPASVLASTVNTLFLLSESRGKEASGIAYKSKDEVRDLKMPCRASSMVRSRDYKNLLNGFVGLSGTAPLVLFGHCRLATNGSRMDNCNNQPVLVGDAVGVHNGIIVNVDSVWERNKDIKRELVLDSELVFRLIGHRWEENGSLPKVVSDVFAQIQGTATIASFKRTDNRVVLATNNGSLFTCFSAEHDVLFFASEKYILESLFKSETNLAELLKPEPIENFSAGAACLVDSASLELERFSVPKSRREPWAYQSNGAARKYGHLLTGTEGIAKLRRCTKCIMPETMPYIEYDEQGVCNYCRSYKKLTLKSMDEMEAALSKRRSTDGSPDCLAAFSGGRDSSIGLHFLKNVAKMNPVAYTYDWGMVNDLARRNQARVCGRLGIEHIIIAANIPKKLRDIRLNISAWLRKPTLGLIPLFIAGDKQFFYYANQVSKQTGLDFIVFCQNKLEKTDFKVGFSGVRPEFRVYRPQAMTRANKMKLMLFYGTNFLTNPYYLNPSLLDTAFGYFSYYLLKRNYFYPFDYMQWIEEDIEKTLIENYDWELAPDTKSSWRIGDGTAPFYNFIYYTVAGFSENDTFRSNQIREGLMTRERALEKVNEENQPRFESVKEYLDLLNLDFETVVKVVTSMPRLYDNI